MYEGPEKVLHIAVFLEIFRVPLDGQTEWVAGQLKGLDYPIRSIRSGSKTRGKISNTLVVKAVYLDTRAVQYYSNHALLFDHDFVSQVFTRKIRKI